MIFFDIFEIQQFFQKKIHTQKTPIFYLPVVQNLHLLMLLQRATVETISAKNPTQHFNFNAGQSHHPLTKGKALIKSLQLRIKMGVLQPYLVGIRWLQLTTFRKGFTFDRFATFFFPMGLVTLRGYLSIPATRACPYGLSCVPSSYCFTMMALRPAYLPPRTKTTLFGFMNLPILSCEVVSQNSLQNLKMGN